LIVQIYEVSSPEEAAVLCGIGVDHIGVLVGSGAFPASDPSHGPAKFFRRFRRRRKPRRYDSKTRTDKTDGSHSKDLDKVRRFVELAKAF